MTFGPIQATALALSRLAYLGIATDHTAISRGAEYLFALQRSDGSWPLPNLREAPDGREGYSMIPLQTAIPLRGLADGGYGTDPRAERAYEWLLDKRLADGAWPTGLASGNYGYVAGYRKTPHSRWGCRSNTTGVLACLAAHPHYRHDDAARRALDLLLGRETREAHTLGYEVARLVGLEPARGFMTYYARFDLGLVLGLCARLGATTADDRVEEIVQFVRGLQSSYGLWQYEGRPQASRWLTFDLLLSLSRVDGPGDWFSEEPRTPFQTYPRRPRRY